MDILDRDVVDRWREEDAENAAENRRRASWEAKLKRSQRTGAKGLPASQSIQEDEDRVDLSGWAKFEREGLLR